MGKYDDLLDERRRKAALLGITEEQVKALERQPAKEVVYPKSSARHGKNLSALHQVDLKKLREKAKNQPSLLSEKEREVCFERKIPVAGEQLQSLGKIRDFRYWALEAEHNSCGIDEKGRFVGRPWRVRDDRRLMISHDGAIGTVLAGRVGRPIELMEYETSGVGMDLSPFADADEDYD